MKKTKVIFIGIAIFLVATILGGTVSYCVIAKQADKKQEKIETKQPKIIHAKFNYNILSSETALKDAVVIAEANLQNEQLINDAYSDTSGSYGDYFVWGANYDKKSSTFTLKTLELIGIYNPDDIHCLKPLGIYKIPLSTFNFYGEGDSLYQNHFDVACFDNYKQANALSVENETSPEGEHLSKSLAGNTLIYKDEKGNEIIKFVLDLQNQKLFYSDANNPQDYINVEKLPNKMIYRDKNGNIIETYEAEVVGDRDGNSVISRINVLDKDGNVKKIVIFDKA